MSHILPLCICFRIVGPMLFLSILVISWQNFKKNIFHLSSHLTSKNVHKSSIGNSRVATLAEKKREREREFFFFNSEGKDLGKYQ